MAKRESANIFTPEGAIDLHVSPEIRAALLEIIDAKPKRVVVDLSRVPYVDSSGIATLILARQSLDEQHGRLMLAAPREPVQLILATARLDKYFEIFSTVEDALAAL
ncbi:MAG TPA: STAS domain-containing protein [Chthoniobacterales bacterium]|jgi:anti-sigma B factor antagonist